MPHPRTPKSRAGSRDGSGEESDATIDPSPSVPTRRTRKRPAHMAREGSADQSRSQSALRSHSGVEARSANAAEIDGAEPSVHTVRQANSQRRAGLSTAHSNYVDGPSAFETPHQARERLALTPPGLTESGNTTNAATHTLPPCSASHASSSCTEGIMGSGGNEDRTDVPVHVLAGSSQQLDPSDAAHMAESLASRCQNAPLRTTTALATAVRPTRSNSNMSPPRPTRSLPRRRASARTQNRPVLSTSNNSTTSYALRSRSTSSSNILAPSNSTANILAASQNSRPSLATGCLPLGGGFDPSYNPPSGMSTPRTPLAEIPLWLADMRSESRRSSTSSFGFADRDDFLSASRSASSRHARTASTSSSQPSSPGTTRTGSTSPVIPFRRSLRGRRPRQSDENARISPSPSYFGDYDALPSPSSASVRDDMFAVDAFPDPSASLSSSMVHLGTSSPATPSVQLHTSSPAMSTRSRTLNRAGSVRNRRMTDPLNTPVLVGQAAPALESRGPQTQQSHTSLQQARSNVQQTRARHHDEPRSASLLERRAATAAAAVASPPPHAAGRVTSRPSSRTSSPARGTRASRRRSTAAEGQSSPMSDGSSLGPRPANLPPLQIPSARLAVHATTTAVPEELPARIAAVDGQHTVQVEPVSPSAFSEMTSLTQGSTASESMNSVGGMPATPSSSTSTLDPLALAAVMHDSGSMEAHTSGYSRRTRAAAAATDETVAADGDSTIVAIESGDVVGQTPAQRKNPLASRDGNLGQDMLGLQLRPRP